MRRVTKYAVVDAAGAKMGWGYDKREEAEHAMAFHAKDHFGPGPICPHCGKFTQAEYVNPYKTASIAEYIEEWAE